MWIYSYTVASYIVIYSYMVASYDLTYIAIYGVELFSGMAIKLRIMWKITLLNLYYRCAVHLNNCWDI